MTPIVGTRLSWSADCQPGKTYNRGGNARHVAVGSLRSDPAYNHRSLSEGHHLVPRHAADKRSSIASCSCINAQCGPSAYKVLSLRFRTWEYAVAMEPRCTH